MSTPLVYRPDIDGLRTVAILPVVLFHLGVTGVSGGFIGVDVFFVISGFLITSIIHHEIQSGSFSMTQFWVRRARRILPAMFVLIMATLLSGWFLLAPYDYAELGRSARYQALFSANIFFWQESGYFDTAAELKPLLHMWSLAVEEQFYFVFPLLLLLLKGFKAKHRLLTLVTIAIASFILSVWCLKEYPSATFYLLPMRAWELMIGSMLVFIPAPVHCRLKYLHSISMIGFAAITGSIVFYDATTPFPGVAALLPTLGTAAIIGAGPNTLVAKLLTFRPAVFFGLLSYSWYLWHWPLIVYTRYWQTEPLSISQQTTLFFTSLLLAYISYKLIENPFRRKLVFGTNKKILTAAACCILFTVLLAQQIRVKEGFPHRLPEAAQKYEAARHRDKAAKRCENISAEDIQQGKICFLGTALHNEKPLFVSWGDSHSGHALPLFEAFATEQHVAFWHTSHIACSPLLSYDNKNACHRYNKAMFALISEHKIPNVILASRWVAFIDGEKTSHLSSADRMKNIHSFHEQLTELVRKLRATGTHVWLVKQVPSQPFEPPKHLTILAMQGKNTTGLGQSYKEHLQQQQAVNLIMDKLAKQDGVFVLDATEILCSDHKTCRTELNGQSLYRDDNHLSPLGALYIKDMMNPVAEYIKTRQSDQS